MGVSMFVAGWVLIRLPLVVMASKSTTLDLHICHLYTGTWSKNLSAQLNFAWEVLADEDNMPFMKKIGISETRLDVGQDIGLAMKAFIDQVTTPPTKLLIVGPSFSSEAEVVAATAKHYSLVQIGYSITSPEMSDPEAYPFFARTIESTRLHNPAILEVLQQFKWKRVAMITQTSGYVVPTADAMRKTLPSQNITLLAASTYSQDPQTQIQQIKEAGAKIMLAYAVHISGAPRIYCRIYQQGLYGRHYQWLWWSGRHGLFSGNRDNDDEDSDGCTAAQVREAMEGTIYFNPETYARRQDPNQMLDYGYTLGQLEDMYKDYLDAHAPNTKDRDLFDNAMDAVMTVALALNNSIGRFPGNKSLEDFRYGDTEMANVIMDQIKRVRFKGATGDVAFDENGDRNSRVIIGQVQGGMGVEIGVFDPVTGILMWNEEHKVWFRGGKPPSDRVQIVKQTIQVSAGSLYTFCACAMLGILLTLICITFNIYFRESRLVKLSSPRINNVIAAGCLLSYLSVIVTGVNVGYAWAGHWWCSVRAWTLVSAFTLAFGSMFSKTWRVHVLFTNTKITRKIVKDSHLAGLVAGVLAFDWLLLILWQIIDPLQWKVIFLEREYDKSDDSIMYQPEVITCSSDWVSYWMGALYAFKALLLIFGMFFAWETRKVKVEALNDSKQIGMCVYNVMLMSAVAVPLVSLLSDSQVDLSYAIVCVAILVCATSTLGLVFGSKMHQVWANRGKVEDVAVLPFAASLKVPDGPSVYRSAGSDGAAAPGGSGPASSTTAEPSPGTQHSIIKSK